MTWQKYARYSRGGNWENAIGNLGPFIAMMAASSKAGAGDWPGDRSQWGGKRGGRRRRGRMFAQGELRLAMLALINEEPRHGYELIKAIEDLTGGAYAPSPGAVYPTLQLLEDEGKIKLAKSKSKAKDDDTGSKKPFKATKDGVAELAERAEEVDALMGRLTEHGDRAEKVQARSPDLFRAMGNLAKVLKNRARAGKLDEEAIEQIVDLIDEMAKRIERL